MRPGDVVPVLLRSLFVRYFSIDLQIPIASLLIVVSGGMPCSIYIFLIIEHVSVKHTVISEARPIHQYTPGIRTFECLSQRASEHHNHRQREIFAKINHCANSRQNED